MKTKQKPVHRYVKIWPFEILIGILLIGGVFMIATNLDMSNTEERFS